MAPPLNPPSRLELVNPVAAAPPLNPVPKLELVNPVASAPPLTLVPKLELESPVASAPPLNPVPKFELVKLDASPLLLLLLPTVTVVVTVNPPVAFCPLTPCGVTPPAVRVVTCVIVVVVDALEDVILNPLPVPLPLPLPFSVRVVVEKTKAVATPLLSGILSVNPGPADSAITNSDL